MVFVGDFRQLEPVGKSSSAIFHDLNPQSWIHAINTYVETTGLCRFKNDVAWGHILRRFREGIPTPEDFREINMRVVNQNFNETINVDKLPNNLAYVTRQTRREIRSIQLFSVTY